MSRRSWFVLVAGLVFAPAPSGYAQKFYPDDPMWVDEDDAVRVEVMEEQKLDDIYDFIENNFFKPGDPATRGALNINSLGEVPDSSWFQNRHGRRRLTLEELARGPNQREGPLVESKPWTIIAAKTEGISPGFTVKTALDEVFFVKFDPPSNPEMSTAAEIISTKFLHAMGFNVPENYLAYAGPDDFEIGPDAMVVVTGGGERQMIQRDLDEIFARVHQEPDGRYRAMASKRLDGVAALGPFRYYGTRSDDSNDVFPHEHRRELRGLRVLSSWINHDDTRSMNTLDMLVEDGGSRFVSHFLIDFGSTLGSGSTGPQAPRASFEYMWEAKPAFLRMLTLGIWDRKWIRARYPDYPAVGRFESTMFEPAEWKPEYPNPAFVRCDWEDAYWAAKIVMRFTDEEIRAIVETGQISDPAADDYIYQTLRVRRDKIGRFWLNRVSSFDNFEITEERQLELEHLASRYGFASTPTLFTAAWFHFDNETGRSTPLVTQRLVELRALIPSETLKSTEGSYFRVALQVSNAEDLALRTVNVYLQNRADRLEIVGIERAP